MVENFARRGVDFDAKVLPCGHYTTGEFPYKFMDGWYLGSFVYSAFRNLGSGKPDLMARGSASEKAEMAER